MDVGLGTPLLDIFRRGEVARDVKLAAAQGGVAPRRFEQLAILMMLSADSDAEIKETAEQTLRSLPEKTVADFIARSDIPADMRAFFVQRGITPSDTPAPDSEDPLIDISGLEQELAGATEDEKQQTFQQRLATMTVPEKVKCATKGTREMRAILIRDPNRMVSSAVLSCPKVNEAEIESYCKMGNVSEDILRTISKSRAWTKNYSVVLALVKNAKTPVAISMNLMQRLTDGDVKKLASDRNVPEPLRLAARKRNVKIQNGGKPGSE
jgi:hypothetical protein